MKFVPLCCLAALATPAVGANRAAELAPFEASYTVQYRGINAGVSIFKLSRGDQQRWIYESSNSPRGMLRAFLPDEITQRSEMRIDGLQVQPLRYQAAADEQSTERNIELRFDWQARRISGTDKSATIDLSLEEGLQDDLSVQVSLMRELLQGRLPVSFKTYHAAGAREHRYTREGTARIATALGELDTVIYRSEREGSTRSNRYWCAPELGYLPVRAQQNRGARVDVVMEINSYRKL